MKHDWDNSAYGSETRDMNYYGRRVCRHCGAEQVKHRRELWMRVTSYRWEPLVGRCPGKKVPTAKRHGF